ncbi:glutamate-cysteine ligase family protein [Jidongwangia harbinensis]|uniref:glutamate-cysteine ligase family protein n=1 Tax=Jidongwangia harbinensis TaxID=2878561 RepID=UPI001CD954EC|nr:glutamate-cysteine ligase family protein [Jidongwangia harbinensis]MCA2218328.1 glutamylcysteine synthetase [Jidongwangia harbinensis]
MTPLTEPAAEEHLARHALTPGPPGFVGAEVELLLARPGLPSSLIGSLAARPPLRHGFLAARSARVLVVSGPPSPGLDACLSRMADDLPVPGPLIAGHGIAVLDVAADTASGSRPGQPESAGITVALEAGTDDDGPTGWRRRWALAHAVAPVLAAAFANAPLHDGRPSGWRSTRQARRRGLGTVRTAPDPRIEWARTVLDAPVLRRGRPVTSFREWTRTATRPTVADLHRHLRTVRPPVAARGHLEIDVADRQPGDGWRVPVAVVAALFDDPVAAAAAEAATAALSGNLWERAARDGLSDPELGAAARECFIAGYAALARQGVARGVRDAVADFTERYVLRGRSPADDVLDRVSGHASTP